MSSLSNDKRVTPFQNTQLVTGLYYLVVMLIVKLATTKLRAFLIKAKSSNVKKKLKVKSTAGTDGSWKRCPRCFYQTCMWSGWQFNGVEWFNFVLAKVV